MSAAGAVKGLLVDLDGVVYRGELPCPGAVEGLERARQRGLQVLFITNNAARTAADTAAKLRQLGVVAQPQEVLTSSRVAAEVITGRKLLRDGAHVLAVGGPGLPVTLREHGLPVLLPEDLRPPGAATGAPAGEVGVVVQGYGPQLTVPDFAEAVYAVRAGAAWVATNDDATIPTERGFAPGNGSFLAAVSHALSRFPDLVTGKPHPPAYEIALRTLGLDPAELLAVGDRLDTDIAGAKRAGLRTALVLTGVHGTADVASAPADHRPDTVAGTIVELLEQVG